MGLPKEAQIQGLLLVKPARLLRLRLLRKLEGQELLERPDGEEDEDEATCRQA